MKVTNVPHSTRRHCSRSLSVPCKQWMISKAVPLTEAILCPVFFPGGFFFLVTRWIELTVLGQMPHSDTESYGRDFFIKTHLREASRVILPCWGNGLLSQASCSKEADAGHVAALCAFPAPEPCSSPCRAVSRRFHVWHQLCLWPQSQVFQWTLTPYQPSTSRTCKGYRGIQITYFLLCIIPSQERKQFLTGLQVSKRCGLQSTGATNTNVFIITSMDRVNVLVLTPETLKLDDT